MRTLHSSPLGGHSGQLACVQRIKPLFYWPHMKQDVIQLVRQCDVCQRNKPEHVLYPGLPQPLPIPQQSWSHISMDFIEKLPLSDGKDTIMVVVDRLTKFAHFITLSRPFSATTVAHVFLEQIFKLHGLPASIVSDRDTIFTSIFWQTIFKTLGVSLHYSTAYHPQSDGQTERVNQCLETYLRCFTCDKPTNWSRWIPMAEYWYNTSFHTSLAMTPFEALYGVKPVPIPLGPYVDSIIPAAVDMVQQHAAVMQNLKEHLVKAQHRIKQFADLHRSERTFQVGDMVFLKLQPYKQQTTAVRACLKLCSKYFGPYEILERIGNVAYKLKLPPESKIHPVFHVSLLKRCVGSHSVSSTPLPVWDDQDCCPLRPENILQRRIIHRDQHQVTQWLVQWAGFSPEEASWEDQMFIQSQFPEFQP